MALFVRPYHVCPWWEKKSTQQSWQEKVKNRPRSTRDQLRTQLMRLPWGSLEFIKNLFLKDQTYSVIGCLGFEERSACVPLALQGTRCKGISLLEIRDPKDAFPNY